MTTRRDYDYVQPGTTWTHGDLHGKFIGSEWTTEGDRYGNVRQVQATGTEGLKTLPVFGNPIFDTEAEAQAWVAA